MDLRMRPRFMVTTTRYTTIEQALDAMTGDFEELSEVPCRVTRFYERQLEVRVASAQRHLWSPQLKLWLTVHDDHIHIRGKFGPEASVWTMFMAGYAVGGMTLLAGLMVWGSQMSLRGGAQWGVWILLGGLIITTMVYGLSHVGRYISRDQMRAFYRVARGTIVEQEASK